MDKFVFKKKYGQNFLKNDEVLNKIIDLVKNNNSNSIVEIGPGNGALTKKLINLKKNITCFEIDEDLKSSLNKLNYDNLNVVFADFLKVDLSNYINSSFMCVANIPYYITTPIISKFIEEHFIPEIMVLMVQKEVGERLSSKESNKEYGAITVLFNYYFDIKYEFTVLRENFYPEPNVDSCILKFVKRENVDDDIYLKFKKLVFDSFKQKRKTLKNNLKNYDLNKINNILFKYNLSISNRAEDINYKIYIEIAKSL